MAELISENHLSFNVRQAKYRKSSKIFTSKQKLRV